MDSQPSGVYTRRRFKELELDESSIKSNQKEKSLLIIPKNHIIWNEEKDTRNQSHYEPIEDPDTNIREVLLVFESVEMDVEWY